jgi:DNA-binding NarL/FixJ family response regulator
LVLFLTFSGNNLSRGITELEMKSDPSITPHSNSGNTRVLLVDDNPQVLQDLRIFLELPGELEVIGEAINGLEAIRLTQELSPDAVVMDLEMPIMDGFSATLQIKSQNPMTKVVILSIHAGAEEREKGRLAGADGFLVKGVSYEVLLDTILGKREDFG